MVYPEDLRNADVRLHVTVAHEAQNRWQNAKVKNYNTTATTERKGKILYPKNKSMTPKRHNINVNTEARVKMPQINVNKKRERNHHNGSELHRTFIAAGPWYQNKRVSKNERWEQGKEIKCFPENLTKCFIWLLQTRTE